MYFNYLEKADPDITAAMKREINRQETKIEMIASENFVNYEVMEAMGSALTNKYAEGYPGKRYYGGCEFVDEVETDGDRIVPRRSLVQNMLTCRRIPVPTPILLYTRQSSNYGDTVLGMDLSNGGHLTHGSPVNISGKSYQLCSIRTGSGDGNHRLRQRKRTGTQAPAKADRCRCVRLSERSSALDIFREIADEVGALFMVDMAHIAGLVAAGLHPEPGRLCRYRDKHDT